MVLSGLCSLGIGEHWQLSTIGQSKFLLRMFLPSDQSVSNSHHICEPGELSDDFVSPCCAFKPPEKKKKTSGITYTG